MEFEEITNYRNTVNNKLILLDYDGTLVNHTSAPDQVLLPDRVLKLLRKLSHNPYLKVVILTGRDHKNIENLIGNLPIDIIAEHGAMIKMDGVWKEYIVNNGSWKKKVLPLINNFVNERPDSFVEEKIFSLAWDYRNLEPMGGHILSRELIRVLTDEANSLDLKILDGNNLVEVIPAQIGKGWAVEYILKKYNYDFVLAIGDDKTDEDMFRILTEKENGLTVKVGYGDTCAKYKLDNVNSVLLFLELLSI